MIFVKGIVFVCDVKYEVKKLPGAPEMAYVNDLKADNFDPNTCLLYTSPSPRDS